jgi:hypothetical protein
MQAERAHISALPLSTVTAMTTGGQIIGRAHSKTLPPAAFYKHITVTPVLISGSHPHGMSTGRLFPPTGFPVICVSIITVISVDPDMLSAWTSGTVLADADRRPKLNYDLRVRGYNPERKAKQRGKNQFSHFLLLRLYEQAYGRSERDSNALISVRRAAASASFIGLARRLAENEAETDGASRNKSIGFSLCHYAWLHGPNEVPDSFPRPDKLRLSS